MGFFSKGVNMKTLLVIDTTFYMDSKRLENMNVKVIPLTVHLDNITYTEKFDDGKSNIELFDKIFEKKELATTSQPTPQAAMDIYQEAIDEGYTKIISLHLSSGLSGTVQGMRTAADNVLELNSDKNVTIDVIDTKLVCQAASIVAWEVDKIIKEEGDIEMEEIKKIISHYQEHIKIFFMVDTLDYLVYGGRLKPAIASVLNVFGVQPMLTIKDGEIDKYSIARSKKNVYSKIESELKNENFTKDDDIIFAAAYTTTDKMARKIYKSLDKEIKANIVDEEFSSIGLIISNHLGPEAYGVGWVRKYKR